MRLGWFMALLASLLGACASLGDAATEGPAAAQAAPGASNTVAVATLLLPVGFVNVIQPGLVPAVMELEVVAGGTATVGFVQGATLPMSGDTAGGADYLFRLTLPAGHYRVSKISGWARLGGGGIVRFAVPVDLPFAVQAAGTRYMGRIVAQNIQPQRGTETPLRRESVEAAGLNGGVLSFNTAWSVDDDLAQYRAALAGLDKSAVALTPFESLTVAGAAGASGRGGDAAVAQPFHALDVRRVSTTLAPPALEHVALHDGLAGADRWRGAFERYRAAKSPKAFAVSDEGDWASASGHHDAATQALVDCARKARRCYLIAVDERLVVGGLR